MFLPGVCILRMRDISGQGVLVVLSRLGVLDVAVTYRGTLGLTRLRTSIETIKLCTSRDSQDILKHLLSSLLPSLEVLTGLNVKCGETSTSEPQSKFS